MNELTQVDPEIINHVIQNRRSVFPPQYSGEEIDQKIIEQVLENANWAPTHKHTEPWRFIVLQGNAIDRLAAYQADLYKNTTPTVDFDQKKYDKLRQKPLTASHIIAIVMHREPDCTIPEIEEVAAVACAVQNMHLTASAYGLGAYWSTGGLTYKKEAFDFFNLTANDKLLGFFFLGQIAKPAKESRRNPIADKVRWVKE